MTTPDAELIAAAAEELTAATTMRWVELARLTPWGDTYEGIGPAGGAVWLERGYIWREAAGGDILCEVTAYRDPDRRDQGARASRVIAKPRGG